MSRNGRIIKFGFKKNSIILNYKIFKLALYKLGLIPSSLGSNGNSNTKLHGGIVTNVFPKKIGKILGKCVLCNRSRHIMRG
jgi:hypothetical protein